VRRELIELLRCPFSAAPLRVEVMEADADEVEAGILRGPATDFPIVAGIPVLRGGDDDALTLLGRGDLDGAAAAALVRDLPLSRLDAVVPLLAGFRPTRGVARRLDEMRRSSAWARGRAALTSSISDPDPLLRLAMLDNREANAEGYRYFRYRLGLPRHLVALGCLAGSKPSQDPVIEVGCGAGHLTWQISALFAPRPVLAVERELYLAWIARHFIAPDAGLVCADARALPVRSGAFSLGVAVDVLSFVSEKPSAVQELERVVRPDGGLVLTALINALAEHEFRGEPLPPDDWSGLVTGLEHRLYDDDVLLERYLARQGPPPVDSTTASAAKTVTILAGEAGLAAIDTSWERWPHALGRLGPHPLLEVVSRSGDDLVVEPQPPSPGFVRDNPGLRRYLGDRMHLPRAAIDDARAGRSSAAVDDLVGCVALLGYPERLEADAWSRLGC
jgi:SAM-dependent methyltransferase/uncharacterized protein YbaR (Trm112 family)